MNFRKHAGARLAAPELPARALEASQDFDLFVAGGTQGRDSPVREILPVVERSGIAKVPRHGKLCRKSQALSVAKQSRGLSRPSRIFLQFFFGINTKAQPGAQTMHSSFCDKLLGLHADRLPAAPEP